MEEPPTETPKKKKVKSEPKATVQVIGRQPGKSEPIIGYSPSGYDPAAEEPEDAPTVTVLKHRRKPHRMEIVVKPPDSAVEFVGKSHAGEGAMPQRCAFALGVLDEATITMKVVSIASGKIIRLEPKIPAFEKREEVQSNQIVLAEDVPEKGRADKVKKLNQLYGTKRSVTMVKKLDALNQKHAPEVVEELENKMKNLKTNQKALERDGAAVNNHGVPHYNIDATTPQQAYPLDKIILEGDWDYLLDIHELTDSKRFREDEDGLHILVHHTSNQIQGPTLGQRILCKGHVLVPTLFAEDFRSDISDIAKDLKMSSIVLRDHVHHLGCKFVRDGNKASFATLPIPLKFPDQGKRKRRR